MNKQFDASLHASPSRSQISPAPCVGLHCSGADGSQWRTLFARMSDETKTIAPDLIGTVSRGYKIPDGPFTLEREAASIITEIEELGSPAHLIGHSYGGALALHIARARPDLVRSLCLYEPTLFSLLKAGDATDGSLYSEIVSLTNAIQTGIEKGCEEFSAQVFTDFWGGLGAWQALSRERRCAMIDWIYKAPSDFDALLKEPDPEYILSEGVPSTIIRGSQTHVHTKRIAELLASQGKLVELKVLKGAGHLGPFTFKESFEMEVLSHIRTVDRRDMASMEVKPISRS